MTSESFSQLLTLYSWFPLAAFIFFLMLIARLYERFSGEKTHFRLFAIPIMFYGAHAVVQTNHAADSSVLLSLLSAAGGLTLIALCVQLYRKMMSHV